MLDLIWVTWIPKLLSTCAYTPFAGPRAQIEQDLLAFAIHDESNIVNLTHVFLAMSLVTLVAPHRTSENPQGWIQRRNLHLEQLPL